MDKKNTSWGSVSGWYDELLEGDPDSYQNKVILPNLLRLMELKSSDYVLDNACGQGFFTRAFKASGANVSGTDISSELINIAKQKNSSDIKYFISPADNLQSLGSASIDKSSIILALQNIENIDLVFKESNRILKNGGKLYLVLNHPAFRIPKQSEWLIDEDKKVQFRRIDSYLSESSVEIDMNPGLKTKNKTISFHRPLQIYFKFLRKNGFVVTRLEEWISHKKSEVGKKSAMEDKARKEIPLFLFLEAQKI